MPHVVCSVTAQNQYTASLHVMATRRLNICLYLSAAGSYSVFTGTITLQRLLSGDASFKRDVESWAINSAAAGDGAFELITDKPEPESCWYRIGCKTGDYTGGAIEELRLGAQ